MTYAFVVAVERKSKKFWWALYGILAALGLYTQYFLALILPAHFAYIWLKLGGNRTAIKNIFKDKKRLACRRNMLFTIPSLATSYDLPNQPSK